MLFKQFRHYLLGHGFTLQTDHAPLQWLSSQKMDGMLYRWALSLLEYQKGTANTNADALSYCHEEARQSHVAGTLLDRSLRGLTARPKHSKNL